MNDIYKEDILEIKRNYIDNGAVPDANELIELVDETKRVIRTYVYTDDDWSFLKETSFADRKSISSRKSNPDHSHLMENQNQNQNENDNDQDIEGKKPKSRRKKTIQDELTCILNYINGSYNQKAAAHLQTFIQERVPFLKEVETKPKKTRAKTAYNTFISKELIHIKSANPDLTPPERMKLAVSNYHKSKTI